MTQNAHSHTPALDLGCRFRKEEEEEEEAPWAE
jgi:hypothetical protein